MIFKLALGLLEAATFIVAIIALAVFIGKTAGRFFNNDPR
jgi:hypothetical protein